MDTDAKTEKDNIPNKVDRIIEMLDQAHATTSRMKPEPPTEGVESDTQGLEAACRKALDRAQSLARRLDEIADTVGAL